MTTPAYGDTTIYPLEEMYSDLQTAKQMGDGEMAGVIQSRIEEEIRRRASLDAVDGMGTAERAAAGFGHGLTSAGLALQRLIPGSGALNDTNEARDFERVSAPLMGTTAGAVGSVAGEVAATAPIAGAAGMPVKAGARLLSRLAPRAAKALQGPAVLAAEGATQGALLAPSGERGSAAMLGAGGALALGGAGKALRASYRGVVKPTAAARLLENEGVDLTVGQAAPTSLFGQAEELAADIPGLRQLINARRGAAKGQWQNAVLNQSRAPGMPKFNGDASIPDRLASAYEGFGDAYAPVKAQPVYPAVHGAGASALQSTAKKPGAFARAAADRGIVATPDKREAVDAFLRNQLGVLPGGELHPGILKKVPAEELLTIRSNIRKEVRRKLSGSSPDYDTAALLDNAETAVTDALESQLPPEAMDALRAADAAYAKHKVVSDAVARSGDSPNGFTPAQLSAAVKSTTERGSYARGAGGKLRALAKAGREAFESDIPRTGVRTAAVIGTAPVTLPLGLMAGTGLGKRLLMGTTVGQRAAQRGEAWLLRQLGRGGRAGTKDLSAATAAEIAALLGDGR